MIKPLLSLLLAACLVAPAAAHKAAPTGLVPEKLVLLYRHGVRAPLEPEAALDAVPHAPLPGWSVPASHLTPHGAQALRNLGAWQAAQWRRAGLLPKGCPTRHHLSIWTNTAQRTIASGQALAQGMAPGCTVPVGHLAEGQTDPLFEPMRVVPPPFKEPFDGAAALASVQNYTGGAQAMAQKHAAALRQLAHVIGCDTALTPRDLPPHDLGPCNLAEPAGAITLADDGRDVALSGAIRRYSGTAQVLALQYLEGMPLRDVGWGRASPATLRALGPLHAALFDVYARPPYMAARVAGPLARHIAAVLANPHAPRISLLVGHDTNIAALSALLGAQVAAKGYAPGDPPPGGALALEVLRDRAGQRWVRLGFVAASPQQTRYLARFSRLAPPATRASLAMAGCGGGALCPLPNLLAWIDQNALR
jgi:4-phytase/acid phosphatase